MPVWLWPHVLSLEAPAVAVLWALALGRLHDVPWWPGVLPGLALSVWTIYLADRTIDTIGVRPEQLDSRHRVYRRLRPFLLAVVLPACLAGLVWMGLWVVPAALLWQCVALAMLVVLYLGVYTAAERPHVYQVMVGAVCLVALFVVNAMPVSGGFKIGGTIVVAVLLVLLMLQTTRQRLLTAIPKEIAGGLLFALGCAAWVRFLGTGGGFLSGSLETILLAALFTCNLTGITAKQRDEEKVAQPSVMEFGHEGMLMGLLLLSGVAVMAARTNWISDRAAPLGWAAGTGAMLLLALHAWRRHVSLDGYRVLADIAVAVPAAGLYWFMGRT